MTSPLLTLAASAAVVPSFDWDKLNPLTMLGNAAAATVTQGWQAFMTALWTGGLWLMGFAFKIVDAFTTPDLSEGGVMRQIYPATFAIGGALALVLGFLQIGAAAWQRDGKGLARLLVGIVQFALAWGGMLGVGAALAAATTALAEGILQIAVGAPSFGAVNLLKSWQPRDTVDAAVSTVLGVCGLLLLLAAIGYLMIMLVRAGALVILIATSPISAAGLLAEATRAWFWKSLRWFVAALMIAPLAALVLGVGKKLTDGVLAGAGASTEAAVGQAVVGTVLVMISAFCPLILFRLLAFVDPGTSSGASFRASMDAAGGVAGLLGGQRSGSGSGAASSSTSDGSSQGEADAGTSTRGRLATVMGGYGTSAGWLSSAGQATAGFSADVLGAAGVGDPQPYFGVPASSTNRSQRPPPGRPESEPGTDPDTDPAGPSPHDPSPTGPGTPSAPPPPPLPPAPPGGLGDNDGTAGKSGAAGGRPSPGGSAGGGAGGAEAGGAAAAAAV